MSKHLKNISVVAGATLVSRVLGLVRDIQTSAVFGTGALNSAFVTAFTLPNLFRRLLGEGALTAALVPTLGEEMARGQRAGAFALVSQVASWLLVITLVIVGGAMALLAGAEHWVELAVAWGADPETARRWLQGSDLALLLFPYLVFVCLAAVFSAALQMLGRFLEPALSPIWLNLAMISLLGGAHWLGWSDDDLGRMHWLCAGVLLGGFLQMAVPAGTLMREGWRPRLDLRPSDPVRRIVKLMAPTVFGSAIYLVNMAVSRLVGFSLNDHAASVLNLATRLMELPIGVFAIAVSTVVFPLITRYATLGDFENLALEYRRGMRLILLVNIPAAIGLAVLAEPIVRLLFERGRFDANDTRLMLPVMVVFALGLPFLSFVNLVLRAFYAQKDTSTPVRAALVSFLVNVALSFALMGPFSTVGLAIASNVAVVVQAWFLQVRLARKHQGLAFHHLTADVVKIALAGAAMGVVVGGGWWAWARTWGVGRGSDAAGLVVLIGAGVAVYAAGLWLLRIEGRAELLALVRKRLARAR